MDKRKITRGFGKVLGKVDMFVYKDKPTLSDCRELLENLLACLKSIDTILIKAEELSKQSLSKLEDNLRVESLEKNALTSLLKLSGECWRSTKYSYGISSKKA